MISQQPPKRLSKFTCTFVTVPLDAYIHCWPGRTDAAAHFVTTMSPTPLCLATPAGLVDCQSLPPSITQPVVPGLLGWLQLTSDKLA